MHRQYYLCYLNPQWKCPEESGQYAAQSFSSLLIYLLRGCQLTCVSMITAMDFIVLEDMVNDLCGKIHQSSLHVFIL